MSVDRWSGEYQSEVDGGVERECVWRAEQSSRPNVGDGRNAVGKRIRAMCWRHLMGRGMTSGCGAAIEGGRSEELRRKRRKRQRKDVGLGDGDMNADHIAHSGH